MCVFTAVIATARSGRPITLGLPASQRLGAHHLSTYAASLIFQRDLESQDSARGVVAGERVISLREYSGPNLRCEKRWLACKAAARCSIRWGPIELVAIARRQRQRRARTAIRFRVKASVTHRRSHERSNYPSVLVRNDYRPTCSIRVDPASEGKRLVFPIAKTGPHQPLHRTCNDAGLKCLLSRFRLPVLLQSGSSCCRSPAGSTRRVRVVSGPPCRWRAPAR